MASSNSIHHLQRECTIHAVESTRDDPETSQVHDDTPNLPDPIYKKLNGRVVRIRLPGNPPSNVSQPVPASKHMDPAPPVSVTNPLEGSVSARHMSGDISPSEIFAQFFNLQISSNALPLGASLELRDHSSPEPSQRRRQIDVPKHHLFMLPEHAFPAPNTYSVTTIHDRTSLHRPWHWFTRQTFSPPRMQAKGKIDHAFDDMPDDISIPQSLPSSQLPLQQLQGVPTTDMLTLQQILAKLVSMYGSTSESRSAELTHALEDAISDDGAGGQDVRDNENSAQSVEKSHGTTFTVPESESDDEEYFTGSEGDDSETETFEEPLRASDRPGTEISERHKYVPGGYPFFHDSPE